jgi:hypothetical protein
LAGNDKKVAWNKVWIDGAWVRLSFVPITSHGKGVVTPICFRPSSSIELIQIAVAVFGDVLVHSVEKVRKLSQQALGEHVYSLRAPPFIISGEPGHRLALSKDCSSRCPVLVVSEPGYDLCQMPISVRQEQEANAEGGIGPDSFCRYHSASNMNTQPAPAVLVQC